MNFEKPPAGGGAHGWIRNISESGRLCFHCQPINQGKGSPQAAHTDTPAKIVDNGLPLEFHRQFFLRTRPWHYQKSEKPKKCQSEQDIDQVLYSAMDGQHCQNKQHSDTEPKNCVTCFYVLFRSIFTNRAMCGSVLWATSGLPEQNIILA